MGSTRIVVAVCLLLLGTGLGLTIKWFGLPVSPPPNEADHTIRGSLLRSLWWIALGCSAGLASGILVVGAGGRLAMRLLAVTGGAEVQGLRTEADEVVGEITVSGTIGFVIFVGVFGATMMGLVYVAIQRWLPGGRATGLYYGLVLLIALGTRLDPLRADNEDFDLVGPAWLSLLLFGALALAQGAAVAAFAGRWSRTQPLLTKPRAIPRYLPMLPVIVFIPAAAILVLVVAVTTVWNVMKDRIGWQARWSVLVGRVALGIVLVIAIPGFVSSIADIAGRSP